MTSLPSSSLFALYPQSSSRIRNRSNASSSVAVSTVGGPRRAPICGLRQCSLMVAIGMPTRSDTSFIVARPELTSSTAQASWSLVQVFFFFSSFVASIINSEDDITCVEFCCRNEGTPSCVTSM